MHRVIWAIFVFSITLFTIRLYFLMGMFPIEMEQKISYQPPGSLYTQVDGRFFQK